MTNTPHSMRTPMGKVRYLGSAKSGTRHMLHTRLTAIALLPLSIAFVWIVVSLVGKDYNTVRATLGNPLVSVTLLLFLIAGIYHMMLGMQMVIEDYVYGEHTKFWLLALNTCFAIAVGLACAYAVLRLSFV
ncbi:succinate dehydrogenase, hydrophobic membrane anchor protein [Methylocella sp. CPCC 101449]|uniref:succinate dehydrogenase, hydrophobic membrane anchor protein n=1 Tax=Methylocella sp. CPCC 101449 TaxID=2987531 RepID=UPI00095A16E6|nr:succinate dehydrogenase, hydrophobic membrane anchor protein [Methylocella sp. CPCC 101449]MBN9080510.1 succinate dehydrogenase, hydrophobic membrane anchor protein [Hyphomicrobiales bacterium]MDT2020522.1 succinate dehydrogenase, hydrophobic membrane anchor protein [Methylocella sp. CPCC 101449]OJX99897.1 MAG: succinate dehydrogenase, hydrophobic membrane anchor protein [Rhizobiales bacterium 62-17]HEV2574537.1 succinate dehydrogenase, hydrophobic membrane anchor protein [Beijerinckiaceae b